MTCATRCNALDGIFILDRGAGKGFRVASAFGVNALLTSPDGSPEGPLHGPRREVVCVASSFLQGKVIFEDVRAFLGARYDLMDRKQWRVQDDSARATIEHLASGARGDCVERTT